MNKKAQGEVITTVLIILLVLAAIVIVWQAVRGTVSSGAGTLTAQEKCIGIDMSIGTITAGTAGTVQITRNSGGTDDAITPVVLVKGTVQTASCSPSTTLTQLASTTCTVEVIASGDKVTVGAKIVGTGKTTTCPVTVDKTA